MNIEQLSENAGQVASLLKTMAHQERLMVLCQLVDGELSVSELQNNSMLTQSAFSQQLKVLRDNQLVSIRKESQQVFYSLADPRIEALISSLHQIFCPQI